VNRGRSKPEPCEEKLRSQEKHPLDQGKVQKKSPTGKGHTRKGGGQPYALWEGKGFLKKKGKPRRGVV